MVRKRKASQRSGLELKLRRAGSNPFFESVSSFEGSRFVSGLVGLKFKPDWV